MTRSCRLLRADSHALAVLVLGICATSLVTPAIAQSSAGARPNILVIIGDDMGVETLASFGVGTRTPTTATLDELAALGVSFNHMWAQALCSPTRATILTGRYGFRTGVGGPTGDGDTRGYIPEPLPAPDGVIELGGMAGGMGMGMGMGGGAEGGMGAFPALAAGGARWGISLDEFTLTQALATQPDIHYDKAAIGKWHLADVRNGWQDHPNLIGFDHDQPSHTRF